MHRTFRVELVEETGINCAMAKTVVYSELRSESLEIDIDGLSGIC
ncbi:MAG: hypothetical protein ACUVQH_08870 [Thermogutta sp.]